MSTTEATRSTSRLNMHRHHWPWQKRSCKWSNRMKWVSSEVSLHSYSTYKMLLTCQNCVPFFAQTGKMEKCVLWMKEFKTYMVSWDQKNGLFLSGECSHPHRFQGTDFTRNCLPCVWGSSEWARPLSKQTMQLCPTCEFWMAMECFML